MKVVYTAPTRAHHYKYASALNAAGCLHAFVSGFPRISPRANAPELAGKLYRSDFLQTLYIASLKAKLPTGISQSLAYYSKIEQDYACRKFVRESDLFLFYNGSGLYSSRYGRKYGVVSVVEVVNSHVEYQEEILRDEHIALGLPWKPFPDNDKRRRLLEYEEADYILLPSEFVRRSFLAKGFPAEKLLKVPYGFGKLPDSIEHRTEGTKGHSFTVLYVGSISIRKGVRHLIEAFKRLSHPQKKLVIVGPHINDGALEGLALTADITFTGVLKGQQLENAYAAADVFCLPSLEDGFGLVLGEALSFGLPVICTYNTGADDIISDGTEGYIVPIKSSQAIWQKLQLLADNPDLLAQLTLSSRLKASKLSGWEETNRNLVDTLSRVRFRQ